MQRNDFLNFVSKYLEPAQMGIFAEVILREDYDYENVFIEFSCQKFKNFESLLQSFQKSFLESAAREAKKSQIKDYFGTRTQEEALLTTYFLKKSLEQYPVWFKERIL